MTAAAEQLPAFYVQGETVRGEPRCYWVEDRRGKTVSVLTRDRRQAERWLKKMLAETTAGDGK